MALSPGFWWGVAVGAVGATAFIGAAVRVLMRTAARLAAAASVEAKRAIERKQDTARSFPPEVPAAPSPELVAAANRWGPLQPKSVAQAPLSPSIGEWVN